MKIRHIISFFAIVAALSLSSCTLQRMSIPVAPVNVQVNLNMDDLEYIGEIEGEAEQTYLLGVIAIGNRRNVDGILLSPNGSSIQLPKRRGLANAYYDAFTSRDDIDFIMPVSVQSTANIMFLGAKEKVKVRAKAFRIKTSN